MKRKLDYPEMADPMVRPRYTGLPTFMRAPYQEDAAGSTSRWSGCRSTAGSRIARAPAMDRARSATSRA